MANASHDQNFVPTLLGTLNTNGTTPIAIQASASNYLSTSDGTTGSNNGPTNAPHDENHVPALLAVSATDGVTPVVVYADSSGNLLVTSA